MKGISVWLATALSAATLGASKPLATVPNFDGKFLWVKLATPSPSVTSALSRAGSIAMDISFARDVKLKKDKAGHEWFTVLLADQGSDWKWHQTSRPVAIPAPGGMIKAGTHTISIPLTGIPADVLRDKKQTFSLGPGASGLAARVSFSVVGLEPKR